MLLDEYTLTQFLGKGTFGEVYLTKKRNSDLLYATKRMSKAFVEDPKYIKYFNNEISILRKLFHKNIVRLEDLKKTTNHYYVIMEYCNGGSLTDCLEKYKNLYHRPFTEEIVQHIMRQIVSAINYIHDLKIIHRDLKLDNILVKFENEIDKNQMNLLKAEVKIIDFGFAAYKDQTGLLKTAIGSPMNMDPLILKKFNSGGTVNKELGYDEKADIWSLGTLCYQMLIGNCAFDAYNMKELVSKVEEGTYKVPTNLSKEVVSFLNAMLQYDPKKRLSAAELIKHAFLIKNVNDFTRIDINQVSKKVYGGELKINIRENKTIWSIFNEDDEKLLTNIPGELYPTETPISESQYLGDLNGNNNNNQQLISKEPINLDKNFIEKEFKPANSTPIDGFLLGKANSLPIPEYSQKGAMPNNSYNRQPNFQTPMKQPAMAPFQNNINNNFVPRTPQIPALAKNNDTNMVTLMRKLENGQIITTQIPMEKLQQLAQNGQNNNEQINKNLMTNFQQNSAMQKNPNQIIQNNLNQNKMNALQHPQINPPHGPVIYPHGKVVQPHMGLQQIPQLQQIPNLNKPPVNNQIQPNLMKPNLIQNNPNLNNIIQLQNNKIQRNQIPNQQHLNNGIQNNPMLNNQVQNNLIQNKLVPNNKIQNIQILNKPISNNLIQNNQIPNNLIQNKQLPINGIQNNQARINQIPNNNLPQKRIPFNQIPNGQIPLNRIHNQNQNQIKNIQIIPPVQVNQAINKDVSIHKAATINQKLQPQMFRARSPQLGPKPLQIPNGQININKAPASKLQVSPVKQTQKNGIPNQPIKKFQININQEYGKRLNSDNNLIQNLNINSARKVVPQLNIANGNIQKAPLMRNNTPNLIQRRTQYLRTGKQLSQNQIRILEQNGKNMQNNLMLQQRLRNGYSPNVQRIGMRPTINLNNNNNNRIY